jgi:hypothetical protein
MPTIHIEVKGLDETLKRLDGLGGINALRPVMMKSLYRLQSYMQEYPPARPRSSYVRTGTLGRKWTAEATPVVTATGNELHGKVGIKLSYAPFVQSARFQARVHRGRWRTDVMAIDANRERIIADFLAEIRALQK